MKLFLPLIISIFLISCSDSDSSSSEPVLGDLVYMNGSTMLGKGLEASGTANRFLDCRGSLGLLKKILPDNFRVAFGVIGPSPSVTGVCGNCTVRFRCEPDSIVFVLREGYSEATPISTPVDFEAANTAGLTDSGETFTYCPSEGVLEIADSYSVDYAKFRFTQQPDIGGTGETTVDTEYLRCN